MVTLLDRLLRESGVRGGVSGWVEWVDVMDVGISKGD